MVLDAQGNLYGTSEYGGNLSCFAGNSSGCGTVFKLTPNTITVNNTGDPATTSGNGFCTLREAIDNANSPGTDTTGGDCAISASSETINNDQSQRQRDDHARQHPSRNSKFPDR